MTCRRGCRVKQYKDVLRARQGRTPCRAKSDTPAGRARCPTEGPFQITGWSATARPPAGQPFVLRLQPRLKRREILQHRRRIHLLAAGDLAHRLLPRLPRTAAEHRPEPLAGRLAAVE